jgi:hypothetical protein
MWYYVYRLADGIYIACSLQEQLSQFDPSVYGWTQIAPLSLNYVWYGNAWVTQSTVPAQIPAGSITFLQFQELFTPAENVAIITAAGGNPQIMLWLLEAASSPLIILSDPRVIGGVDGLVAAGLLTSDRAAAILANQQPPASS